MANTSGLGNLNDGQHLFWVGDFARAGHAQVLIYSAPDSNWWLGAYRVIAAPAQAAEGPRAPWSPALR